MKANTNLNLIRGSNAAMAKHPMAWIRRMTAPVLGAGLYLSAKPSPRINRSSIRNTNLPCGSTTATAKQISSRRLAVAGYRLADEIRRHLP